MANLSAEIKTAGIELEYTARQLETVMRVAARDLMDAAERVAAFRSGDPTDDGYVVNSLGELQASGAKIDCSCATFEGRREHYRRLMKLQEA